jgi:hypothetical protein
VSLYKTIRKCVVISLVAIVVRHRNSRPEPEAIAKNPESCLWVKVYTRQTIDWSLNLRLFLRRVTENLYPPVLSFVCW